jgi:hypothetical protein
MNEEDYIEILPNPKDKKCKFIIYAIYIFLSFGWLIIACIFWYSFNIYFALLSIPVSYIIIGIISSKMKLEAIPFNMLEMSHSNYDIAKWFSMKNIC